MKLKILYACHKKPAFAGNEVFLPVAVGEKGDWATGLIRDDDGENIADKNDSYNELTAVYYAWKNYGKIGAPDVIGLNHYRRFFIFEDRPYAYYEKASYDGLEEAIRYDPNKIVRLLQNCDFVAPKPNIRRSVYDNFVSAHGVGDLDESLRIIETDYPEYADAAKTYVSGRAAYFYNAFLFRREDFFRYCEFLFGVLGELEKRREGGRLFVSEVLTGVFFTQLKKEGKEEIRLPVLFIGKKPTFAESVAQTKGNFSDKKGSFLYRIKPLIVFFTPNFLLLARKRKTEK